MRMVLRVTFGILVMLLSIEARSIERLVRKRNISPEENPTARELICERMAQYEDLSLRDLAEVNRMINSLKSAGDEDAEETVNRQLRNACSGYTTNDNLMRRNLDDNSQNPLQNLSPSQLLAMVCEDRVDGSLLDGACSQVNALTDMENPEDDLSPDGIQGLLLSTCMLRLSRFPEFRSLVSVMDEGERKKRSTESEITRLRRDAMSSFENQLSELLGLESDVERRMVGGPNRGDGALDNGNADSGDMDQALDAMCMVVVTNNLDIQNDDGVISMD